MATTARSDVHIRRELLSRNPYFLADVKAARRDLGIPEGGFREALKSLAEAAAAGDADVREPAPEWLLDAGEALGLKFREYMGFHRSRFVNAPPILKSWASALRAEDWVQWWAAQSRQAAGVGLVRPPSGPVPPGADPAGNGGRLSGGPGIPVPLDPEVPLDTAALKLAGRYGLGERHAATIQDLILGMPSASDYGIFINMDISDDGETVEVTIRAPVRDLTLAEWDDTYRVAVQPQLLSLDSRPRDGQSHQDWLERVRKRSKPGRPVSAEQLDDELGMWMFCHESGLLKTKPFSRALDAYLDSLPPAERSKREGMDLETFRRAVKRIERLLRPRGSAADLTQ